VTCSTFAVWLSVGVDDDSSHLSDLVSVKAKAPPACHSYKRHLVSKIRKFLLIITLFPRYYLQLNS